jgi:U3 small nucleolar RNA-associated protein 18
MASQTKKNALRLLHVPTQTVFQNWPTTNTPVHYTSATAFSPHSGYYAVGNDKGKALLFRLNHYENL